MNKRTFKKRAALLLFPVPGLSPWIGAWHQEKFGPGIWKEVPDDE